MVSDDNYTMYWEIESSDGSQIVVLYSAYTGALVRYYIDVKTGDTYVTEYVPGITDEEEKIDESFNVKDYFSEPEEESERTKDDNARIDDNTSIFEDDMMAGFSFGVSINLNIIGQPAELISGKTKIDKNF